MIKSTDKENTNGRVEIYIMEDMLKINGTVGEK